MSASLAVIAGAASVIVLAVIGTSADRETLAYSCGVIAAMDRTLGNTIEKEDCHKIRMQAVKNGLYSVSDFYMHGL